jgi:hypothetical protein
VPRRTVPKPPGDLAGVGLAVWRAVWAEPQVSAGDALTVERLARLEIEAADLRALLQEEGRMLRRPIQNSKGEVLGMEPFSHPAINDLRRIGAEAAALCDALGLSPRGRMRLGLVVLDDPKRPDFVDELREQVRRRRQSSRAIDDGSNQTTK